MDGPGSTPLKSGFWIQKKFGWRLVQALCRLPPAGPKAVFVVAVCKL